MTVCQILKLTGNYDSMKVLQLYILRSLHDRIGINQTGTQSETRNKAYNISTCLGDEIS